MVLEKGFIKPAAGEEIVITGMAGSLPDSKDLYHFRDNLYNKVDMVSDDFRRWKPLHPEVPQRVGKLFDIDRFDQGFFGVTSHQCDNMDPMIRIVLEKTFEAILDAGHNPADFVGTNTAVFVGTSFSETERFTFYQNKQSNIDAFTGTQRSMIAKRVSYALRLNGPAFNSDTACSSSLYALDHATTLMKQGLCDKALVCGMHLCLLPVISLQFSRLGVLSRDGACKCFDVAGNGYARSEASVTLLLEKAKDAKRIYAEIIHTKSNSDGYKKEGIAFPSTDAQKVLMREFYQECQVDPRTVTYVEAHATGTKVGDPEEVYTLDEVFCNDRDEPLLVGSVKSNIGHNEPASGMCGIVKVLLGMEAGYIPPNIHYNKPREGVEALEKGRMLVVADKVPFPDERDLCAVNNFGFGGSNAHVLLHWNTKKKINNGEPEDDLPRLICVSGRIEEGVTAFLDDYQSRNCDYEYAYLVHQAFRKRIENHFYRGFGVYTKQGEIKRAVTKIGVENGKLCLVFGSHGRNFYGLIDSLMRLPIFARSIKCIDQILQEETGFNLIQTVANSRESQILGTVAVQIALADTLKGINLTPYRIIGIGSGELVAAYMDDYLTLKEVILGVFYISSSLSKNNSRNVEILNKILPTKRNSCKKWLPARQDKLSENSTKYFTNLLTTTNDRDIKKFIPERVHTLVIGTSAAKLSSHQLSLIDGDSEDPIPDFLSNLGSLYLGGIDMELNKIYPSVQLPVSRGTPMLSPMIKWNHSRKCNVYYYNSDAEVKFGHRTVPITTKSDDWSFVAGHVIDGRNLFPATGYLFLAMETYAVILGKLVNHMRVVFENVRYIRATTVPKEGEMNLMVLIQPGLNLFEISEGGVTVVSGKIYLKEDETYLMDLPRLPNDEEHLQMTSKDCYKELKIRGYHYSDKFCSIRKCSVDASIGSIEWDGNWIAFMDCMLQQIILQKDTRSLYVPTTIELMTIDVPLHIEAASKYGKDYPSYYNNELGVLRSGGVEIRGLAASVIPRRKGGDPVLEISKFVPNETRFVADSSIRAFVQVVLENMDVIRVKMVEVCPSHQDEEQLLCLPMQKVLEDLPLIQQDITVLTSKSLELPRITVLNKALSTESNCLILVVSNILETTEASVAINAVKDANGFIVSRESTIINLDKFKNTPFTVLCSHTNENETLVLLKPTNTSTDKIFYLDISDPHQNYEWVPKLQDLLKKSGNIVLYSQGEELSGLLGLVTCLRKELNGSRIRCVLILDEAPRFDPETDFYKKQLDKNLAFNIWKDGSWGTYRHLLLSKLQLVENEHRYINVTTKGDLSTLSWLEGRLSRNEPPVLEEAVAYVYYAALNFKDLMLASERISLDATMGARIDKECVLGFEFAGRTSDGKRVMGMGAKGSLATLTSCDKDLLIPIPDSWTMEDAATVIVVYATVIQSLVMSASLQSGQTILIHSATGGVGQAAINICLYYGLKIFVTVGTPEKKDFIQKHYPQIKQEHIGNSRDTSFESMVEKYTNGKGVDYVLNSLSEEKLIASVRCLAKRGKFIEIGKYDLGNNSSFTLHLLEKEAQFVGMDVEKHMASSMSRKEMRKHLINLTKCEAIKPLPRTVFKEDEVEQAFRYLGLGKHIGKVLIKIRDEEFDKIHEVPKTLAKAIPRFYCDPRCSYLICGGLGGFGLELADMLVIRGARKLVLTSKSGLVNGYQRYRIRLWESYGVTVLTSTLATATVESTIELIKMANSLGPVDGIFNLAAVLRDALFENQTIEAFKESLSPKAVGTKNLDSVSRRLCPNLRYFVVFSSVSCGRGNAGQTNYGMANSIMERICERRKKDGYPGVAIQWGAVGEVGLVAKMQEDHRELVIGGTLQQKISSCLQVLDNFLRQDEPVVASMVVAEKKYGVKANNLFETVLNIMGITNLKAVSAHTNFSELGMDSMMAVEIKQTLEREYELFLTAQDIRGMTVAKLKELSSEQESSEARVAQADVPVDLQQLLGHIGTEELSNIPLIKIKTLAKDDENVPHVLVLPGIEGMASIMEPICGKLRAQVSCLQYCTEHRIETIAQLAESLLPHVESVKGDLTIIAYSIGCVVATELLHILESRGRRCNVIFLDGSPELAIKLVRTHLPVDDDNMFQMMLLSAVMSRFMSYEKIVKYQDDILKCKTYEEKVEYIISIGPKVDVSHKYIIEMCTSVFHRLTAVNKYQIRSKKLKSPVCLFKAASSPVTAMAPDYGLSSVFQNQIDVVSVEGNHVTMLGNDDLAEELNGILEATQAKNENRYR